MVVEGGGKSRSMDVLHSNSPSLHRTFVGDFMLLAVVATPWRSLLKVHPSDPTIHRSVSIVVDSKRFTRPGVEILP